MGEEKTLSRAQWTVLTAAFLGWMFDGLEMGLFPIVARPALQHFLGEVNEDLIGSWNGIIIACFLLGAASGGLLFGWLGDKVGRVRAMVFSILAYSIFTGCGYFANAPWQLGALRFLAALGMGGEWSLGVALVMECWPERHRPLLAGAIGAASNVGFLLIAVLGMLVPVTRESWRWMMLAGAVPALVTLFIVAFVPESERWKASVRRGPSRPIVEIFSRGMRKTTVLAICFAGIPLIGTWAAVSGWIPVWTDQLAEKPLTQLVKTSVVPPLRAQLARDGMADLIVNQALLKKGYLTQDQRIETQLTQLVKGVALLPTPQAQETRVASLLKGAPLAAAERPRLMQAIRDQLAKDPQLTREMAALKRKSGPAKAVAQVMISIGAIIGCFIAPLVGGRLGRRPAYFGLCVLSLASCAYLFRGLDTYDALFLLMVGVVGCVTAAFYGWLPLYLPELFPTRVRATGQGLCFNFGRILASAGALQMGQLVGLFHDSYARAGATVTLIYALGLVLIWLAPETKGRPLPE